MHEEIVILLVSSAIIIEPAIPTPATRYDRFYDSSKASDHRTGHIGGLFLTTGAMTGLFFAV